MKETRTKSLVGYDIYLSSKIGVTRMGIFKLCKNHKAIRVMSAAQLDVWKFLQLTVLEFTFALNVKKPIFTVAVLLTMRAG